jgi:hypothetical protein
MVGASGRRLHALPFGSATQTGCPHRGALDREAQQSFTNAEQAPQPLSTAFSGLAPEYRVTAEARPGSPGP